MRPDLLSIPGTDFVVPAYGFLVGVGLVAGWISSLRRARQDRLPHEELGTAYVLSVVFATFGAHALWLAQHPDAIAGPASFVQLTAGTFATGGGLIMGVCASLVFCARRGVPFFAWADCAAPAALLALALERVGAFLAGTGFGNLIDPAHPLGVRFPAGSPVYAFQAVALEGLHLEQDASLAVHPVQLYGAVAFFCAAGVCAVWRSHRRFSGQIACFALTAFVAVRMLLEDPFRADRSPEVLGPVRLGHATAAVFIAIAAIIYLRRARLERTHPGSLRRFEGGRWSPKREGERAQRGAGGGGKGSRAAKTKRKRRKK